MCTCSAISHCQRAARTRFQPSGLGCAAPDVGGWNFQWMKWVTLAVAFSRGFDSVVVTSR